MSIASKNPEAGMRFKPWIMANYRFFSLGHGADPDKLLRLKPLAEMLLALDFSRDFLGEDLVFEILDWAWQECEHGDLLLRFLLARPDFYRIVTIVYHFKSLGRSNRRLEISLKNIASMRLYGAVEAETWSTIAADFALSRVLGRSENFELYDRCFLYCKPEPWAVSEQCAYAITHEVFYACDFGRRPLQLPKDILDYLLKFVPVWARVFHDKDNYDLVGEMSMVYSCLGDDAGAQKLVSDVLAWQEDDGWLKGPIGAGQNLSSSYPNDAVLPDRFFRDYHTTLVALCAFSMANTQVGRTQ